MSAAFFSNLISSPPVGLPRARLSRIKTRAPVADMPEQKRPIQTVEFDDDLSEFERARRTSKTWSMGQD